MIIQNLQFTLRNNRNRKLYAFANLSGLTVGIVSASLILIYISYELSFDRFHINCDRIFRVYSNTHLQFDMVVSLSGAKKFFGNDFFENRMNTVASIYLLTNKNTDFNRLEKSVSGATTDYQEGGDFGDNKLYHIQPLTCIHLNNLQPYIY